MKSVAGSSVQNALQNLLTNDVLLSIFDKVNVVHKKRLSRVCKRWRYLIDITFLWVREFSAVDDRKCVTDWEPSDWLGIKLVYNRDYIRIPRFSASAILNKAARHLPNLKAINLECGDVNSRIIRTILDSCKKVERINLDSSTGLNHISFILMAQAWSRLRHVNLSCCTEVNEASALFLIKALTRLESLNLCGTRINGECLVQLNPNMKRLDISYCWSVQAPGQDALAKAKCIGLEELSVNSFDFDGSEMRLVSICNRFVNLKHLRMSIGPCVAADYFIDRIKSGGFSAIARLKRLETLIIEKICIMDNAALVQILKGCSKLKYLRLNLGWLNRCSDESFFNIDQYLPDLEELHILYPSALTSASAASICRLANLKSLSLVNTTIDNEFFKNIDKLTRLNKLTLDECRKITLKGFNQLVRVINKRDPQTVFKASLIGTGIFPGRLKTRRNLSPMLHASISHFRSARNVVQLPIPVIPQ